MKNLPIVLFLLFGIVAFSQNQTVDLNNPISDIDITYTKGEGITRLTVILNAVKSSQDDSNSENNYSASVTIQGLIFWKEEQNNPKKNILKNVTLQKLGSDKPFVLFADLYDGENNLLRKPSSTNKWEKISFKLNYSINGNSGQLPTINLYPPVEDVRPITRTINISNRATQKAIRKGIIELKSSPTGTRFEVTELKITKKIGSSIESKTINANELGSNRFSYNGELELPFNTTFDIETINAKYFVECKAIVLGNNEEKFNNSETEIVFVQDFDLELLNRNPSYAIILSSEARDYLDNNIETKGNGKLGIRFLNPQYKNIRPIVSPLSDGKYSIKLENLQEIPSETSSTYYYTDESKNKDISAPLIISKKLPRITDFRFNGVKGDSLLMSFKLPGIGEGTNPEIFLSGDNGKIGLGGDVIVKKRKVLNENDKDKYDIIILRQIANVISKDEIVKDISITVTYGGNSLYSLTVTVFNQKLYDQKLDELKVEAEKKVRDKEKIKNIVNKLLEYGTAIGNAIDNGEVTAAIDGLQTGKGDKIKAIMSDIGKWALIAGKIVLPLLI